MKRLLVTVVLALLAFPTFGAIQYEFMQRNTSDDSVVPATDLSARATIDGDRSRVEFLSGNLYPPGTYAISDGSRRIYFVDPTKKWFTEINTSTIATALAASNLKIENVAATVEPMADKQTIAGIEADHYRITMSYDITMVRRSMPLKQHVKMEIEMWTTTRFGSLRHASISNGLRTGNADIDRVLDAETTKIPGFPLQQKVTVRTKYDLPARSNIKTPTARTMTREMWVTKIQETQVSPALFAFPSTYRRASTPELPKQASEVLTFEPGAK